MNNENLNQNNTDNNIKPIMYKNENDMSQITLRKVLYGVIFILIVVIVILILKKQPIVSTSKEEELEQKVNNYKVTIEELGKEAYYKARDVYGDFILDTKRLCGNLSKDTLVDNYYMKSMNSKFATYTDLSDYVKNYFYGNIVSTILTTNRFKNYSGYLYCVNEARGKNIRYIGVDSITLVNGNEERMEYKIKEKYFDASESLDCIDNCNYLYKENSFVIEKKDNRWLVTEFIFPYL